MPASAKRETESSAPRVDCHAFCKRNLRSASCSTVSSHQFRRDRNTRSEFFRKIPEKRSIRRLVWPARVVAPQKASVWARSSARAEASVPPRPDRQRLRRLEMRGMRIQIITRTVYILRLIGGEGFSRASSVGTSAPQDARGMVCGFPKDVRQKRQKVHA